MSDNSSDEDDEITPVFAFRAENIVKKQHEAYEEMLKKVEEEDTAKAVEDEENDLLVKIHEKLKKKPRAKRKPIQKAPSPKPEEKGLDLRRSNRRKKKEHNEEIKDKPEIEKQSPINLPARAKKRLLKIDLENKLERKRIAALNKRALSSYLTSSVDDQNASMDIETKQNISLKISYLSDICKISVNENEKCSSIISKVADLFKLKVTEVTLCFRDEIISLDDTPSSLKVKAWDIIECIPYKSTDKMQDDTDSNKILIKMQTNDKKKIDIYAHKLEKFQDIMERYSNVCNLPLKDLIFEFDGEKISCSDTPDDLDMECGSCVDVKVIGGSSKPSPPTITYVDLEKETLPHKMLDICVLD